jgi:hypothetical protein
MSISVCLLSKKFSINGHIFIELGENVTTFETTGPSFIIAYEL